MVFIGTRDGVIGFWRTEANGGLAYDLGDRELMPG